jgi:hypothetical protein
MREGPIFQGGPCLCLELEECQFSGRQSLRHAINKTATHLDLFCLIPSSPGDVCDAWRNWFGGIVAGLHNVHLQHSATIIFCYSEIGTEFSPATDEHCNADVWSKS